MNTTENLKLPQYTEDDIFDLQDINKAYNSIDDAYGNIDDAYKEVVKIKDEIPKTNATAEVINARGGKETLGKRLDEFGSQLDKKANEEEVIKKGYGTLNDFDEDSRRQILGMDPGEINAVLGNGNVKPNNIFGVENVWKSVNCLNPLTATVGVRLSYFNNQYTFPADALFAYSDYIEVEVGDKFTVDRAGGAGSLVAVYYDVDNNPLGRVTAVDYGKHTIEVTNDNYKKIRINVVIQNRDISTVMIARGDVYPSEYQPYAEGTSGGLYTIPWLKTTFNNSIGSDELQENCVAEKNLHSSLKDKIFKDIREMSLPEKIFSLYNKECKIFYKSIMNSKNKNFIYKSTYQDGKYKIRDRYFTLDTLTSTKSDTFYVYDDKTENLISQKSIQVVCTDPSTKTVNEEKNILIIGDSFIQSEVIPDRIKEKLIDTFGFTNLKFIGGKTTKNGVKHQGMGGYGLSDFVCLPEDRRNNFNINPYWNDETNKLDFKNYISNLNVSGGIDYCVIHLAVNDMLAWGLDGTAVVDKARIFIDQLHSDYPNCKILLCGVVVQSEINDFYSAYMHNKRVFVLNRAYESFAKEDKYKSFLTYVDTCSTFDSDYGYPYELKTVCEGSTETIKVLTDYLHPYKPGYYMIADNITASILYNL